MDCREDLIKSRYGSPGIYDERRYQANGPAQPAKPLGKLHASPAAAAAEDRDSGLVDCPCGVTYDDGQAMIECERCRVRSLLSLFVNQDEAWVCTKIYITRGQQGCMGVSLNGK